MDNLLCENGVHISDGVCHSLKCKVINDNCTFIRWCTSDSCVKMTQLANKCRYRGDTMVKKKEIVEVITEEIFKEDNTNDLEEVINKSEIKEEICKVCFIKKNKIMLDFKGYGIEVILRDDFDKFNIGKFITVNYKSDIGKSDFEVFI